MLSRFSLVKIWTLIQKYRALVQNVLSAVLELGAELLRTICLGTRPFCFPPGGNDYFTSLFWLAPEGHGWLTAQKIWGPYLFVC